MARHGAASRASLPDAPPPDYALLVTGRVVLPGGGGPTRGGNEAARTAQGYLPRWRAGGRRPRLRNAR